MQIVIDISKEDYKALKQGHVPFNVLDVIMSGTSLPKGHGDLIDVNRKITVSVYDDEFEYWFEETMTVLEALNKWSDEGVRLEDVIIPADTEGVV